MFPVCLATSLLLPAAPSASAVDAADLLRRLPAEFPVRAYLRRSSTMQSLDEDGPIARLMQDDAVAEAIDAMITTLFEDDTEEEESNFMAPAVDRLAEYVDAAAVGIDDKANMALVLRAGAEFESEWESLIDEHELDLEDLDGAGSIQSLMVDYSEYYILRSGDLWAIWSGWSYDPESDDLDDVDLDWSTPIDEVVSLLEDAVSRDGAGDEVLGTMTPLAESVSELVGCMLVDLEYSLEDDPMLEALELVGMGDGTIVMAMGESEGSLAGLIGVDIPDSQVFEDYTDILGEYDPKLLEYAPKDVLYASAVQLDLMGFVEWVAGLIPADEDIQLADGLSAASAFLGVDVETDVLDNLTGDLFMFYWRDLDLEGVDKEDLDDSDAELVVSAMPVVGMLLDDPDPFYTLIELGETYIPAEMLTTGEEAGFDTWEIEPVPGASITLALGEDTLVVGNAPRVVEVLERMAGGAEDGFMTEARREQLRSISNVGQVTGASLAGVMDSLLTAPEVFIGEPVGSAFMDHATAVLEAIREVSGETLWIEVAVSGGFAGGLATLK